MSVANDMANNSTVGTGSWVEVQDGELRESWRIVDAYEADAARRLISMETPLARALLGHRAGEEVRVNGPGGRYGVDPQRRVRNERGLAIAHLVGQSRAYLLLLDDARAELAALHHDDLGLLLRAIDGAEVAVRAVDSIGTEKLKAGR